MSTRISARGEGGGVLKQKIKDMSCNQFNDYNQKYGHPNVHNQCHKCSSYALDYPLFSKKKLSCDIAVPKRYSCLRLDDTNKSWVCFAGNDVFENYSNRESANRQSANRELVNRESANTDSDNRALGDRQSANRDLANRDSLNQDIDVGSGSSRLEETRKRTKSHNNRHAYANRKIGELTSKIVIAAKGAECVKSQVDGQVKAITSLKVENDGLKTKLNTISKRERRLRDSNIVGDDDCVHKSIEDKERFISKNVEDIINKMYPRTQNKRKAMVLTKMISEGKIFGGDGKDGYDAIF